MPYFVYLLRSTCHKGATYIGFSTDPGHRLRQHNGDVKGGARHTSKYSPWTHVCVISGFLNKNMALMFEWHWQHSPATGVNHQGRGPHRKLILLVGLLGDELWAQCDLTVNFLEDDGFHLFTKLNQRKRLHAQICRVPKNIDFLREARPAFIDVFNRSTSKIKDYKCPICHEEVAKFNEQYVWCCRECRTIQHILCSASSAIQKHKIGSKHLQKNVFFPHSYDCYNCKLRVSRVEAARMTFNPKLISNSEYD